MTTNESTAANLLLAGDLNAAQVVTGPDRARLEGARLKSAGVRNPVGEMLFNERSGAPDVRPARARGAGDRPRPRRGRPRDRAEGNAVASVVPRGAAIRCCACPTSPRGRFRSPTSIERAGQLLDRGRLGRSGTAGNGTKDGSTPLTIKFIYDAATATHAPAAELVAADLEQDRCYDQTDGERRGSMVGAAVPDLRLGHRMGAGRTRRTAVLWAPVLRRARPRTRGD